MVTQGTVIVSGVTFTTDSDSPTIVVTGGTLILRDDVIESSTGFVNAAISVSGTGSVDLGTSTDPGGNTLDIMGPNGLGEFVHNTTGNSVPQFGDTFEVNGNQISQSDPVLSFSSLSSTNLVPVTGQNVTLTATVQANPAVGGTPTGTVDDFYDATTSDRGPSRPAALRLHAEHSEHEHCNLHLPRRQPSPTAIT